jgi:hypothetical protein
MDPVVPPGVDPEAVLSFSSALMMSVIAGIVQAFVQSGLPVKHVAMFSLILGIGLSIATSESVDGILIVAVVRGVVVGMAAAGVWMTASSRVDTNGE